MSREEDGRSPSSKDETPEQRHAKFLEKHQDRMRRVDQTLDAVKKRSGRANGSVRPRRAGV